MWAAVDPLPLIEDEVSYVLQSRIFATGHWTAPSPPIPEFFQQAHVLTTPAVASKYMPGHALLMSIGTLLGAPVLVPLLLTALTGGLLFALVRRVSNEWVALLAWLAWLSDPINLRFRAAYYSEVTSDAMWFLAWWSLLEWRRSRERKWMLALAAAIGWGAITRPLTMLAFAIPVGVVVIRDVVRESRWRDLAAGVALGTLVLCIIPLWSAETTGNWRVTPLAQYTHDYLPFDKLGFGIDKTPPALPLLPVERMTYAGFYTEHATHTVAHLPRTALDRLEAIASEEWSGARLVLVPFAAIGLASMSIEVGFALVCSIALFVAYLAYGHWAQWTLYYFEAMPVLDVLAALGIWNVMTRLRAGSAPRRTTIVAALLGALAVYEMHDARWKRQRMAAWDVSFNHIVDNLPVHQAVIFVHYEPRLEPHATIVTNSPHLASDPVWIVNDLGARDAELMKYAGTRVPLALYEDAMKIEVDRQVLSTMLPK
ncbi:MAG TPA: glycosyltransferase family 39 protein [Gemmatimonadaceae bacterium]